MKSKELYTDHSKMIKVGDTWSATVSSNNQKHKEFTGFTFKTFRESDEDVIISKEEFEKFLSFFKVTKTPIATP